MVKESQRRFSEMASKLKRGTFGKAKVKAYYRPGTSDVNALEEVIGKRAYRRGSVGFDVEAGEHWLDLGANIGAFALYCKSKGATAECYEPMEDCFAILAKNVPEFKLYNKAVTNVDADEVTFYEPRRKQDRYRSTLLPRKGKYPQTTVANLEASLLNEDKFDGVKMDIEGSEFGIIDDGLLPRAPKLVFEYHLSRDNSLPHLVKRIRILRKIYKNVVYCPELARLVKRGTGTGRTYFDRCIYCWELKA
jgi:FkbM family methyltransferase